jgi:hypothetical protein
MVWSISIFLRQSLAPIVPKCTLWLSTSREIVRHSVLACRTLLGCKTASIVLAGAWLSVQSWSLMHFMSVVGIGCTVVDNQSPPRLLWCHTLEWFPLYLHGILSFYIAFYIFIITSKSFCTLRYTRKS